MNSLKQRSTGGTGMRLLVAFIAVASLVLIIDAISRTSFQDVTSTQPLTLTVDEIAHMRYMREEEKLAHDVYLHFSNIWGNPVFGRIAQAEQRHTDAVLALLNAYKVPDPSAHKGLGEFVDPRLADLYRTLINKGEASVLAALMVGGLIEEVDIADLEIATASTQRPDLIQVYTTIHRGSRNHLRAFAKVLEQMGVTYQPQKLSASEVQGIITTPMEGGPPK